MSHCQTKSGWAGQSGPAPSSDGKIQSLSLFQDKSGNHPRGGRDVYPVCAITEDVERSPDIPATSIANLSTAALKAGDVAPWHLQIARNQSGLFWHNSQYRAATAATVGKLFHKDDIVSPKGAISSFLPLESVLA